VPNAAEVLLGAVRLAHALAAAVWIGGTLLYILVRPRMGSRENWRPFREALRSGIAVFILTGTILATDRLAATSLPPTYFAVLGAKVALGIWMFFAARQIGLATGTLTSEASLLRRPEGRVLGLGIVIYGMALVLRGIYEASIRR
jgi:hypothetical protein